MFSGRRWFLKAFSIFAISLGIGILIGTLLSWGWLMVVFALFCIGFGVVCVLNDY